MRHIVVSPAAATVRHIAAQVQAYHSSRRFVPGECRCNRICVQCCGSVIVHHPALARQVQALVETDMLPGNSWNAADEPDQYVPLTKRGQVRLWQLLPLKPVL